MKVKRIVANIRADEVSAAKRFYEEALARMERAGFAVEYGPADELWGVRRLEGAVSNGS